MYPQGQLTHLNLGAYHHRLALKGGDELGSADCEAIIHGQEEIRVFQEETGNAAG